MSGEHRATAINQESKIKAAIIGLGRIASLLEEDVLREKPCTHAGAIAAAKECELAAGCDSNEERRRLFAKKWRVRVYDNALHMLRIHTPQILVIATHPDSHYRYCSLAAENKIPVVICEKPLADNIKDSRKTARLCLNGGPIIIANHERRYSQDYIHAKRILEEGKLGAVVSVCARLYMGKKRKLLDQLWHDGTHLADALMFLTDSDLKHRKRWGSRLSADSGTAWLLGDLYPKNINLINSTEDLAADNNLVKLSVIRKFKKRIPVIIEIGADRDHLVFEIEFSCEKGRLCIGNGVFEVFRSVPSPYAENFRSLKHTGKTFTGPTGYFKNMLKDAIACVKDPKLPPVSTAADGLKVIEYLNSVKAWKR